MIAAASALRLTAALIAQGDLAAVELSVPTPPPETGTRWTSARLRLAAGSEWDTNARRAVQGEDVQGGAVAFPNASRPFDVVSDGLVRVVVDSAGSLRFNERHSLRGHYVLGLKRFFSESTEDLLVQEVGLTSEQRWLSSVRTTLNGAYKGSRIRSQLRDYDVLTGGLGTYFRFSSSVTADVQARLTRFIFSAESRFNYWGPRASLGVTYRPYRRVSIAVRGGATGRFYDGRALVEGVFVGTSGDENPDATILTFCENPEAELEDGYRCTPAGQRRDIEAIASLSISYRGPFLLSAQYLLRLQRSNSDFENIDRHRIELTATFPLPWRLTVNALGALQFNQGVSITDQKFLADADENQNNLNIGIQRPIFDDLYLEARYSLFTNQFSSADVTFFRHTAYLGLGYRADLVDVSR